MNLPNKISVARICMIPVFVLFFFLDAIPYNHVIAAVIFALAALTDLLDGHIARSRNLVTNLGKFLDPIADKVLVATAFILMLTVRDIYYISTMSGKDKNYVLIHDRLSEHSALLEEEKGIKIRMTMNEVEQLLAGKGFYRCQSGYLVNWAYVKRIYTEKSNKLIQNKVLLVDGDWRQTLPVSRDKKQEMLRLFHSRRRGGERP